MLVTVATERQLVAGLREGGSGAFDAIYEAYRPRLFSFLARLSGDPALAEDLLQETFLRLARSAPALRADTRIGAWLFTVARNLFVSQRRWALLDLGRLAEKHLWQRLRATPASPFALAAASETERQLEQAIANLPTGYREILLLVAIESMTPTEAAAVVQLEPATVRKRLQRARAMIERELERCQSDDHSKAATS